MRLFKADAKAARDAFRSTFKVWKANDTLDTLGRRGGVHPSTMRKWSCGAALPKAQDVFCLAMAFDGRVSREEIIAALVAAGRTIPHEIEPGPHDGVPGELTQGEAQLINTLRSRDFPDPVALSRMVLGLNRNQMVTLCDLRGISFGPAIVAFAAGVEDSLRSHLHVTRQRQMTSEPWSSTGTHRMEPDEGPALARPPNREPDDKGVSVHRSWSRAFPSTDED
jgi:hypothetical protein